MAVALAMAVGAATARDSAPAEQSYLETGSLVFV
jgi:hypothetical protein